MKRIAVSVTAIGLLGAVLAGRMSFANFETEKPLPVILERGNPAAMLAAVRGAPARPAHTELASFAAG